MIPRRTPAVVPVAEHRYKVVRAIPGWSVAPGDVLRVLVYDDHSRELAHFAAVDVHGHRDGYITRPVRDFPGWAVFEMAVADGMLVRMGTLRLVERS